MRSATLILLIALTLVRSAFAACTATTGGKLYKLQEAYNCMNTYTVSTTNKGKSINAFEDVTQAMSFFDWAKNPPAYTDTQVDYEDVIADLRDQISTLTYAEIQETMAAAAMKLRDAHFLYLKPLCTYIFVHIFPLDLQASVEGGNTVIRGCPQNSVFGINDVTGKYDYYFNSGPDLATIFADCPVITTINGVNAVDWMVEEAATTHFGSKDRGANFNDFVTNYFSARNLVVFGRPNDDTLTITTEGGSTVNVDWLTTPQVGSDDSRFNACYDASSAVPEATAASEELDALNPIAFKPVDYSGDGSSERFHARLLEDLNPTRERSSHTVSDHSEARMAGSAKLEALDTPFVTGYHEILSATQLGGGISVGIAYRDNGNKYCITRISSFAPESSSGDVDVAGFVNGIDEALHMCKDAGVTQLIIDVAGNGGGLASLPPPLMDYLFGPDGASRGLPYYQSFEVPDSYIADSFFGSWFAVANGIDGRVWKDDWRADPDSFVRNFGTHSRRFSAPSAFPVMVNGHKDYQEERDAWLDLMERKRSPLRHLGADNTVLLTDGTCGSACAMFTDLILAERPSRSAIVVGAGGVWKDGSPLGMTAASFISGNVLQSVYLNEAESGRAVFPDDASATLPVSENLGLHDSVSEAQSAIPVEYTELTPDYIIPFYLNPARLQAGTYDDALLDLIDPIFETCLDWAVKSDSSCEKDTGVGRAGFGCDGNTGTYTTTCEIADCHFPYRYENDRCVFTTYYDHDEDTTYSATDNFIQPIVFNGVSGAALLAGVLALLVTLL